MRLLLNVEKVESCKTSNLLTFLELESNGIIFNKNITHLNIFNMGHIKYFEI